MDTALVVRAQGGDREAFATLASSSYSRLHRVAQNILADLDLAEDATQQAVVSMWRNLPQLREPQRFEAWSYRILVNCCYGEARKTRRWLPGLEAGHDLDADAASALSGVVHRDQLERGFRRLPMEQRAVVVLHHPDGMTGIVESNSFSGAQRDLVAAAVGVTDSDAVVRANSFTERSIAISISAMGSATVADNELIDNALGVSWSSTQPGTIAGNVFHGGQSGIVVSAGSPVVTDNTVEGTAYRGISIGRTASPSLSGNTICDCGTNLWVAEQAQPEMGDNDICPDEPAE